MALKSISFLRRKAYKKHQLITELVKDKHVIHYGCVDDDVDLIKHKHKTGYYLHKLVTDSAASAVGIDLNKGSFKFLGKEMGVNNIVYGDVEDPGTFDVEKKVLKRADIVLIPDLIEHLNNPGNMLSGIIKYFSPDVRILILTPNPFAWYNFVATLLNKEIFTPYHTAYYTTESISILLDRYGIKIDQIMPVVSPKKRGFLVRKTETLVSKIAMLISPGFADLFLYDCTLRKKRKRI